MKIKLVWLSVVLLIGGTIITVARWRSNNAPLDARRSPAKYTVAATAGQLPAKPPTGMRPIVETKTKLINYTIIKPVYEKHQKEISYTVMKPVYETREKTVTYTVCTMVPETKTKTVEYTTCRMVPEEKQKTVEYQQIRYVPIDDSQVEPK